MTDTWPQDLANSTITSLEKRIRTLESDKRIYRQDAETALALAEKLEAENVALHAQLEAIRGGEWQPVEDGYEYTEDRGWLTNTLRAKSDMISITKYEGDEGVVVGRTNRVHLPPDLRLCHRVPQAQTETDEQENDHAKRRTSTTT